MRTGIREWPESEGALSPARDNTLRRPCQVSCREPCSSSGGFSSRRDLLSSRLTTTTAITIGTMNRSASSHPYWWARIRARKSTVPPDDFRQSFAREASMQADLIPQAVAQPRNPAQGSRASDRYSVWVKDCPEPSARDKRGFGIAFSHEYAYIRCSLEGPPCQKQLPSLVRPATPVVN